MDNKDLEFDSAKFDVVWRRVISGAYENSKEEKAPVNKTETSDAYQLRAFIDEAAHDALLYGTLAAMCSSNRRQSLLRIASDKRCHLKKLKARYFILTGGTYQPAAACPLICAVPETLRRKYRDEKEGSAAYRAAAGKTPDQELADTYLALAEDAGRHFRILGCLIESLF